MKILICYATYSSGTQTASEFLEEHLKATHDVTRKQVKEVDPDEFKNYELIIFGSPSWEINKIEGMPHQDFIELTQKALGKTYEDRTFAVFGLGDETYAHFCGAVDHLELFIMDMKAKLVHPSLKIEGFYFKKDENVKTLLEWSDKLLSTLK